MILDLVGCMHRLKPLTVPHMQKLEDELKLDKIRELASDGFK